MKDKQNPPQTKEYPGILFRKEKARKRRKQDSSERLLRLLREGIDRGFVYHEE